MLSKEQSSRLLYIRIMIKDVEVQLECLGRCFTHLDNKPNKDDKEEKQFRRVLKKIKTKNTELADLWDEQEEITRDDFAREI